MVIVLMVRDVPGKTSGQLSSGSVHVHTSHTSSALAFRNGISDLSSLFTSAGKKEHSDVRCGAGRRHRNRSS